MPDLASLHPQIVHFVVVLGMLGVGLRLLALASRFVASATPAEPRLSAASLICLLAAAGASVAAATSGDQAHGPAERIPGAREAVEEHEELGERTRNFFLAVAGLELLALALPKRERARRGLHVVSAATGVVAAFYLYEAAEHGGELVYSFAGGVGTRSGDPADIQRLLVAGLYYAARADREAGRSEEAARLTTELARQLPDDPTVSLLAIQSLIEDRKDPAAGLAALDTLSVPAGDPRLATRIGLLRSQALIAAGQTDSARAVLEGLARKFPESPMVRDALEKLK
jgi:uncharacterized membrane protein